MLNKNEWCELVSQRCWAEDGPKPNVYERHVAMAVEMGKLRDDGELRIQGRPVSYHSIDQIEAKVNELQCKYRVSVIPSVLESGHEQVIATASFKDKNGTVTIYGDQTKPVATVRISIQVTNLDDPSDRFVFEWSDDGDDLTKAGSFAVKYAYMKLYHVHDGSDEETGDSKVGGRFNDRQPATPAPAESRAATSTPRPAPAPVAAEVKSVDPAAIPPNGGTPIAAESADPATREQKLGALIWYAGQLPDSEPEKANWPRGRILTEIGLYEKRARDGKLSEREKQVGDSFRYVFSALKRLHLKASNCGDACTHQNPVAAVFRLGGEIATHIPPTGITGQIQ